MAYDIDVIHLDRAAKVLWVGTLKPWRLGPSVEGTHSVVELQGGEAQRLEISAGVSLNLIEQHVRATRDRP